MFGHFGENDSKFPSVSINTECQPEKTQNDLINQWTNPWHAWEGLSKLD